MRTIAHISDLHFGRTDADIVAGLLVDLTAERPDLIVVSGDLTQSARRREFTAARRFIDALPAPVLVVPGNHDVPSVNLIERMTRPFERYQQFISPDLFPFIESDAFAVLGVNTARRMRLHWNWAEGSISHAQMRYVRKRFEPVRRNKLRILVTHHPFLPPPDMPRRKLAGRARIAVSTFEAAGIDLLLAGHLHRGYSGDARGHHPHIERSIVVAQAATATSTRLRDETNSYNVVVIEAERLGVRVRAWIGGRFEGLETLWFARSAEGWHDTHGV